MSLPSLDVPSDLRLFPLPRYVYIFEQTFPQLFFSEWKNEKLKMKMEKAPHVEVSLGREQTQ